jgi:hypothetical protein
VPIWEVKDVALLDGQRQGCSQWIAESIAQLIKISAQK